jgi:hypothetical protein
MMLEPRLRVAAVAKGCGEGAVVKLTVEAIDDVDLQAHEPPPI